MRPCSRAVKVESQFLLLLRDGAISQILELLELLLAAVWLVREKTLTDKWRRIIPPVESPGVVGKAGWLREKPEWD
jgi:hypothetical protein